MMMMIFIDITKYRLRCKKQLGVKATFHLLYIELKSDIY